MAAKPQPRRLSVAEYFQLDDSNPNAKYEYYDGFVHMMSGGSLDHSEIAVNVLVALRAALRGTPCRVFNSDARVQLAATRYVYPDVSVSCADKDRGKVTTIQTPSLVFEVLSPSNVGFDRGTKADYYRDCPSIEEYVLIDADKPLVEVYRRAGPFWELHVAKGGDTITLASVSAQITIADVYDGIDFPQDANPLE